MCKSFRGQHIGEKLVKDCMNQGKALGFKILQFNAVVETNMGARHLYEKMGFRRAKTAMELFFAGEEELEWMEKTGFFLPENFRFCDEYNRPDMKGPAWKYPEAKRVFN